MSGSYCRYCGHRCFVDRIIPVGPRAGWSGHLATCARGKEHDREATGYDADSAFNPAVLAELTYVADGADVVHLADVSPLGYVTGCDLLGLIRAVDPVPITAVCSECVADASGLVTR